MPAPKRPNNTKATEASAAKSRRRGQETMAAKLHEAGWFLVSPVTVKDLRVLEGYDISL